MTRRLIVSPEAEAQSKALDYRWRANRRASPNLFAGSAVPSIDHPRRMDLIEVAALELLNCIEPKTLPGVAIDALVSGFNSKSLVLLAGEVPALADTAELRRLFRQALAELGLQPKDRLSAVRVSVGLWLRRVLESRCSLSEAVSALSEIVNGLPSDDERLVLDTGFGDVLAVYDQAEDLSDAGIRAELLELFAAIADGRPPKGREWHTSSTSTRPPKVTEEERIRRAFNCRLPVSYFREAGYHELKTGLAKLGYEELVEWLPLALIHEIKSPDTSIGDMLVYLLDGNARDGWTENAATLRDLRRQVLDRFTREQAEAVRLWLKRVAKRKYGKLCLDDIDSAILYWAERERVLRR